MNFFRVKNLKLSELQVLDEKINERIDYPYTSRNTDSTNRLFSERKRKIQELLEIYAAEEASYNEIGREDREILNIFDGVQPIGNVHEDRENII